MNDKNDTKYPIRTDILVMPADEPKQLNLGFKVWEYLGSKCVPASNPDGMPIDTIGGIKVGDELIVWGSWIVIIDKVNGNKASSHTEGGSLVPLEFDIDDRHCWVATCMINPKAVKKLMANLK